MPQRGTHRREDCADCIGRPDPGEGDAYRAYALISNALAAAFSHAELFVLLSRREHLAALVWADLTRHELRAPRDAARVPVRDGWGRTQLHPTCVDIGADDEPPGSAWVCVAACREPA